MKYHCHIIAIIAVVSVMPAMGEVKHWSVEVSPDSKREMCSPELPDGHASKFVEHVKISLRVKDNNANSWTNCSDVTDCGDSTRHSGFTSIDYEIDNRPHAQISFCWSFENKSTEALDAEARLTFKVRKSTEELRMAVKPPGDTHPQFSEIEASNICISETGKIRAGAFGLRPRYGFVATRGDVITLQAKNTGSSGAVDPGCAVEATEGKYRIKITHIIPVPGSTAWFQIEGMKTDNPPTDLSSRLEEVHGLITTKGRTCARN
jgi:hypothetical protein